MSGTGALLDPNSFADAIRDKGERTPGGETGPAGESGPMQVLPGTAASPGFGVKPAIPGNPGDLDRLGRDYAKALLQKYRNVTLASAAYNAGPGRVDQWLREFGDPRTGQISESDWIAKVPSAVTQGYVGRMQGSGAVPPRPMEGNPLTGGPTAQQAPPQAPSVPPQTLSSPIGPDPRRALALLQLLTPPGHSLTPVDYDPWAIQRAGAAPT